MVTTHPDGTGRIAQWHGVDGELSLLSSSPTSCGHCQAQPEGESESLIQLFEASILRVFLKNHITIFSSEFDFCTHPGIQLSVHMLKK
jgi:hypothetical protein